MRCGAYKSFSSEFSLFFSFASQSTNNKIFCLCSPGDRRMFGISAKIYCIYFTATSNFSEIVLVKLRMEAQNDSHIAIGNEWIQKYRNYSTL